MIEFHLDSRSGLAALPADRPAGTRALRLGLLREGDQLPTVKRGRARLAINPNTVLKAYRELEYQGSSPPRDRHRYVRHRKTPSDASLAAHGPLRHELAAWLAKARRPGWTTRASRPSSGTPFAPPRPR